MNKEYKIIEYKERKNEMLVVILSGENFKEISIKKENETIHKPENIFTEKIISEKGIEIAKVSKETEEFLLGLKKVREFTQKTDFIFENWF